MMNLLKKMMRVLTSVIAPCLLLTSCYPPDRNLKRSVTEDEIVGTWIATSHFQELLGRYPTIGTRPQNVQIELRSNHTFTFTSVLDEFSSFEFVEASGTWKLEHKTSGNSNVEKENALLMIFSDDRFVSNYYMNIAEEDGRLLLWRFFGDPDTWEFIEYSKLIQNHNSEQGGTGHPPARGE